MIFALSEKVTKVILGIAIIGLIISVIVHLEAVFLSGIYQELYGSLLFGIGFVSILFPVLYETHYSAKLGYDFRTYITKQYFPKWGIPVWTVTTLYFSALFGTVIIGVFSGETDEYVDRLFWSSGNVVVFVASSFYHQTVLNVGRS